MTAVIIILCVLALFLLALVLNAAIKSNKARKLGAALPAPTEEENQYYASRLAKMISCKTVSTKQGMKDEAEFKKLRETVKELFPLLHEKAQLTIFSDDCWVYKLEGADNTRNIMLMSHHDVVDVNDKWTHSPFDGEISDSRIWGRGAVDTKTPLFAEMSAVEELLADGFVPACNLYIASSHNEEYCGDGIPTALKYFEENGITFEVILDEGGGIIEPPLAGMKAEKTAMVAVHEKGRCSYICTAQDGTGHAGLSGAGKLTPVERMAAFISEVNKKNIFIRRMNKETSAMFAHLAPYCGGGMKLIFSNVSLLSPLLKSLLPKINAQVGGMLGTTCSFNNIEYSKETLTCRATAFMRPIDEDDYKQDLARFTEIAKKYGITVEAEPQNEYHRPADMTKPAFGYTMQCIADCFPQYPAAPFILPAGSDARHFSDICRCVLRFAPIRLSAQQLASVHSEDENMDIEAVSLAVRFYRHFVKNYK